MSRIIQSAGRKGESHTAPMSGPPKSAIVSTAAKSDASGFMILMAGMRSSKNPQPYDLVAFTKLTYRMASEKEEEEKKRKEKEESEPNKSKRSKVNEDSRTMNIDCCVQLTSLPLYEPCQHHRSIHNAVVAGQVPEVHIRKNLMILFSKIKIK